MWNANKFLLCMNELDAEQTAHKLAMAGQAVQVCRHTPGELTTSLALMQPDILLLGECGGREQTLDMLKTIEKLEHRPRTVVITAGGSAYNSESYLRQGACSVLSKSASAAQMIALASYEKEKQKCSANAPLGFELAMQNKISETLIALGMTPRYNGYGYIRDTLNIALHDPYSTRRISKSIYPAVAAMYRTTPAGVERCIRNAIIKSWEDLPERVKRKYFGTGLAKEGHRPTNSEYIFTLSEFILLELRAEQYGAVLSSTAC